MLVLAKDERWYVYSCERAYSELFLVDGVVLSFPQIARTRLHAPVQLRKNHPRKSLLPITALESGWGSGTSCTTRTRREGNCPPK